MQALSWLARLTVRRYCAPLPRGLVEDFNIALTPEPASDLLVWRGHHRPGSDPP